MRRCLKSAALLVTMTASLVVSGCGHPAPTQRSPLTFYFSSHANADQRAAAEERIRGMPSVRDVRNETAEQAYEKFKQEFKDRPELLASVSPSAMPESITATADSGLVEAIETVLLSDPAVGDAGVSLPSRAKPHGTVGVVVQVNSGGIPDDQRTAIEAAIRAVPGAKPARFESPEAAETRLKRQCRDQRGLVRSLTDVREFPSYRFVLPLTADSYGSREFMTLRRLFGVTAVLVAPTRFL